MEKFNQQAPMDYYLINALNEVEVETPAAEAPKGFLTPGLT
jgi:hypothetical protein